jgi:hypothetical protein
MWSHGVPFTMTNTLRIRINWAVLLENMSKQEGRPMTDDEVRQWLTDAGFTQADDNYWLVSEADLGHLDPTEVISAEEA